ncbi:MAG: hypothetical protein AAGK02_17080, partial [Pseudomonadota bacterium]
MNGRPLYSSLFGLIPALALSACAQAESTSQGRAIYAPLESDQQQQALLPTLFVANKRGNTLSKVSLLSGEEVQRVDSCINPHELATSPGGQWVALACYGGTTVDIFSVDDLSKAASIELGENARPHGIVWHEDGSIYVTAEGRQSIFRIENLITDKLFGEARLTEFATGKEGSHMIAVAP